jgi:hypothetical protein
LFLLWSDVEVSQVPPDLPDLIALGLSRASLLDVRESGAELVNPVACPLLAGLKAHPVEEIAKVVKRDIVIALPAHDLFERLFGLAHPKDNGSKNKASATSQAHGRRQSFQHHIPFARLHRLESLGDFTTPNPRIFSFIIHNS